LRRCRRSANAGSPKRVSGAGRPSGSQALPPFSLPPASTAGYGVPPPPLSPPPRAHHLLTTTARPLEAPQPPSPPDHRPRPPSPAPPPPLRFLVRIEPPLHALRRDSPPPRDPNGPRLPDTTSAFVGPRLSLHNRVQSLIRSGDLDGASATARAAVSSRVRPTVFTCNAVGAAPPATTTPSGSLGSSSAAPTSSPTTPSSSPTARPAVSTPRWRSTAIYLNLRPSPPHQSPTATSPRASSLPAASATPLTFSTRCSTAAPVLTPLSTTTSSPDTSTLVIGTRPSSSSMR
jgi:hypothetical protein